MRLLVYNYTYGSLSPAQRGQKKNMLIDFHTHAFPDAIADRAIQRLEGISKHIALTRGTVGELREQMKRSGVDVSVICSIATNAKQTTNVNNFAIETNSKYGDLYPLGSVFPDGSDEFIESELRRIHKAGLRGIKIHPDYIGRYINEPCYDVIWRVCSELGLFVISHSGVDFYSPDDVHCTPEMVLDVTTRYPDLKFIAAHAGGLDMYDDVERYIVGKPIWIDLSLFTIGKITQEQARRIILNHDPSRMVFGSDNPWNDPADEKKYIEQLSLPDELLERIWWKNAADLLGEKKI